MLKFDLTGGQKTRSNFRGGENIAGWNMHPSKGTRALLHHAICRCSANGPLAEKVNSKFTFWPRWSVVESTRVCVLITTGPSSGWIRTRPGFACTIVPVNCIRLDGWEIGR